MRALIQRVAAAWVEVDGQEVGRIGPGLLILLGVAGDDTEADAAYLAGKLVHLRIFADDANRFNRSAREAGAEVLLVSQFTLYADTRKGRRPDFTAAAPPEPARRLYEHLAELLRGAGMAVATGRFQEYMQVHLQNDGPVTLLLDSADRHRRRG